MRLIVYSILISLFLHSAVYAEIFATLTGRVTAEDTGEGIAEIIVRAMPSNRKAITDSNGRYIIHGLNPGMTYSISFYRENSLYINEINSVTVPFPIDKFWATVDRALVLGASASGSVYDQNGAPISGAAVISYCKGQPAWLENQLRTYTETDGKFMLHGLPESDSCTLSVAVYGHAWVEKQIAVRKGEVMAGVEYIMRWDDNTGIAGRAETETGKPVIAARIVLVDSSGKTVGIAQTDIQGKFSIIGVEPGTYVAYASWEGSDEAMENLIISRGKSLTVDFKFKEMPDTPTPGDEDF